MEKEIKTQYVSRIDTDLTCIESWRDCIESFGKYRQVTAAAAGWTDDAVQHMAGMLAWLQSLKVSAVPFTKKNAAAAVMRLQALRIDFSADDALTVKAICEKFHHAVMMTEMIVTGMRKAGYAFHEKPVNESVTDGDDRYKPADDFTLHYFGWLLDGIAEEILRATNAGEKH